MMMIMMMISNKKFLVTFFFFFLCAIFVLAEEVSIFDAVREDFEGIKDIRSLVQKDASLLESIGPGGQTPLISAVLQGKFHAVKTLLELGANAFATEKDGYNVLHAAGFQGRPMILRLLLDHFSEQSIDMNVATDQHADGYYPLHRACWGRTPRHAEAVRVMLNNGVPYDLASRNGKTCNEMTRNELTRAVIQEAMILLVASAEGGKGEEESAEL